MSYQAGFMASLMRGQGGFDPNSIPGLKLGLLPAQLQNSSGRVTGWINAATQQQLTADGLYTASDADFNGQSTMTMRGFGGGYTYMAGVDLGTVTDGITVILVAQVIPYLTNDMMWWYINAINGPLDLWNFNGNNMVLNTFNSTMYGVSGCVPPITQPQILSQTVSNNGPTNNTSLYVNGVLQTVNTASGGHTAINLSNSLFYLGECTNSTGYSFNGKYSTALVYNRMLTSVELDQVHTALKAQYAF